MLFGWQESWAESGQVAKAIVFVTAAQMLCGVAKDLTKLGGKTVTKLVTPDEKEVCMGGGGLVVRCSFAVAAQMRLVEWPRA
jgi:hypothetical protein